MAPDNKLATVSDTTAPAALKPPVDPATLAHRDLLTGDSGGGSPPTRRSTRPSSSTTSGRRRTRSPTSDEAARGACRASSPTEFIADAEARLPARADERARVAVPAVADRLERPVRAIRCAASSSRSRSRLLPDHPKLGLDSLHEQADAPVPGLTHRYPDKALFLRARHLPGLLPLLHAQLRGRPRHRRGREGPAQGQRASAGSRRSSTSRSRPELEDIVISRRRRVPLRAEQITQIGETLLDDAEHPPHPLRHQGPGGDAAEDPHRRRVDRRAHRASSSSGRKLHKEVVLHTHFNHPNEITGDHQARDEPAVRARHHRAQPVACCSAASTTPSTTMKLLVKRLGLRQRAPVLRLRARPREGRRGPAHHAADRRSTSRSTCAASTAGFNTPTFVVDAPGGGGKRDVHSLRALRPRDRHLRVHRPVGEAGRVLLLLRPDFAAAARGAGPLGRPGRAGAHDRGSPRRRRQRGALGLVPVVVHVDVSRARAR